MVPAVAAVIVAAFAAWWPAVLLAVPAAVLVLWQLPPLRRSRSQAAAGASRGAAPAVPAFRLRLFTLNAKGGAADPAAVLRILRQHDVDVLAVQELTPSMVTRLAAAGLTQVLPFSHLDPRPGRHRLVGALAANSATAGRGSGFGSAASADRSTGRISGDADRGTSTRSHKSTRSHTRARGHLAARAGNDPADARCRR